MSGGKKREERNDGRTAVGIIFLVFTFLTAALSTRDFLFNWQAKDQPVMQATVASHSNGVGRRSHAYTVVSYTVDGVEYKEHLRGEMYRPELGSKADVVVDPAHPRRVYTASRLEIPNLVFRTLKGYFAALLLLLISILLLSRKARRCVKGFFGFFGITIAVGK